VRRVAACRWSNDNVVMVMEVMKVDEGGEVMKVMGVVDVRT
jgi:hypothetical protein